MWAKTNNVNSGANIVVREYDATTDTFVTQNAPVYANDQTAQKNLDPAGGGTNIATGALYVQNDVSGNDTYTYKVFERYTTGATLVTGTDTAPSFCKLRNIYYSSKCKK